MFDDLKQAILDIIMNADRLNNEEFAINRRDLYLLQQEYNIFFVEPTDKQIDIIQKP